MKNILFVVSQFPAVSETFIKDQIVFFRDKGSNVSVLCHSFDDVIEGASFYSSNLLASPISRVCKSLSILSQTADLKLLNIFKYGRNAFNQVLILLSEHFIKHNNYDIIYCHYGTNGKFISQLKEAGVINPKSKIVVHFHGVDLNPRTYKPGFYNVLNKFSDLIVVGSDLAINHLKALGVYRKEKVIKIPVSIDVSKFQPKFNKDKKVLKIITVGRLIELKGHLDAIKVIRKFRECIDIPFIYSIVGKGPLHEELDNLITEYNLNDSVQLLGAVDHSTTLDLLAQSDIYLYCGKKDKDGRQEMQGLAIVEAMASQCIVISSTIGGVKEYLTEQNALLCSPGNIDCFVNNLFIAATDKRVADALKVEAYRAAINIFDRNKNYEKLISAMS